MIRIEEVGDLLCPVFVCDQCDQLIQGKGQGLIQWPPDGSTFTVLHKGPQYDCARQWQAAHGKDWMFWRPLETFVDQLAHNTAHPFEKSDS
jgi:hypothetical protein